MFFFVVITVCFDLGVLNMCNLPKGNVDLGLHDFQTLPFRASVDPHMLLVDSNPIFATLGHNDFQAHIGGQPGS